MSEDASRIVYVVAETIRQRFRDSGQLAQVRQRSMSEELYEVIWSDSLAPPKAGQVAGTRTQMVRYFRRSDGALMAIVHRYLRPDGTLGASGLPDPKWLRDGDQILVLDRRDTTHD